MDELRVIKGLEMFTASQTHEGAAYLHEIYCKLDEVEKKEFINWMWHESENYKRVCLLSDPISKKESTFIEYNVKNSILYFLQEITYTSENIREWLKQAAEDVEPQAQDIVSKLKNRLNQLYPTKEQRTDEIKRNHQYYCEQISEYSTPIFNPLDVEGSINRIRFYGLKFGTKLPTPANVSVSDFALPSERLKAIAMPPLRAKRIVELLNELLQELDKQQKRTINIYTLEKLFDKFKEQFVGINKEQFIDLVNKGEPLPLNTNLDNKNQLIRLFDELCKIYEVKSKTNYLTAWFGKATYKPISTIKPIYKEIDIFLSEIRAKTAMKKH